MSHATQVDEVMKDVFFRREELVDEKPPEDEMVVVEGLVARYGFHKRRLKENEDKILKIAQEVISERFLPGGGGGASFLELVVDREGNQWAEQKLAEALFCLCKGLGKADFCAPRELWPFLPGGVPYIVFFLDKVEEQPTRPHSEIIEKDGKWFFYDETWSHLSGPYETREKAAEQLKRYAKFLDEGPEKMGDEILMKLMESGINFAIRHTSDLGMEVQLGDYISGVLWKGSDIRSPMEALHRLAVEAAKHFPDSDFARWRKERWAGTWEEIGFDNGG